MGDLANFAIETDSTVLLEYKDGRSIRVPVDKLRKYLQPPDLARVSSALKLRRDFLRRNMPKLFIFFVAASILAAFLMLAPKSRLDTAARAAHKPSLLQQTSSPRTQTQASPIISPTPTPASSQPASHEATLPDVHAASSPRPADTKQTQTANGSDQPNPPVANLVKSVVHLLNPLRL